ncbi:MAG TPA: alpha/beta hydrolase [Acetobacteraceae bacterium]|nr:alpha/beta hydrolase [Acetobacteraceae bacterium]
MLGVLMGAGVLAFSYGLIATLLYLFQRRILYHPNRTPPDLAAAGLPQVRQITVPTPDGLALVAWYLPPAQSHGRVVLYLHGNAGHIGHRAYRLEPFQRLGWGVLLLEYRGYGGNPGKPSEAGLILDAHAGMAALQEMGFPLSTILVWGESLGTGPAVQLAVEHKVGALLLEAPYTSIADIARSRYRLFPVDWLLLDRFDSLDRIGSVQAPVLVMHGAYDTIIPTAMGRAIYAASPDPKRLWIAPHAGHLDMVEAGATEVAGQFVAGLHAAAASDDRERVNPV